MRKVKNVVNVDDVGQDMWEMRATLFRFLTRYTGDTLQRLVEVVQEDNGWEAWRQLELHCEPAVGMREAQVMAGFNNMIMNRAKNPLSLIHI